MSAGSWRHLLRLSSAVSTLSLDARMDMLPQGWQQRINAMRAHVSERLASLSVGQEHAGLRAPLVLDVAADEAGESYQSLPAALPTRRPATATVTELSLPDICAAAQEALILGSDVLKLRDGQHGDAGDAVVVEAIQEAAERLGVAIQSSRTASELEMETALTLHDGLVCVPPRPPVAPVASPYLAESPASAPPTSGRWSSSSRCSRRRKKRPALLNKTCRRL